VRFGIDLPAARIAPFAADGALSEVRLDGFGLDASPGDPALPSRILLVAVPPAGEVRVRATATGEEIHDGIVLAPIPPMPRPGEEGAPRLDLSRDAYASARSCAPERARIVGVSWMRNQRVASVAILPADFVPARHRLTTWRRIDVEVTVAPYQGGGRLAEAVDPFEDVYRQVLVNYEQGRAWRRPAVDPSRGRMPLDRAGPAGLAGLTVPAVPETSVYVGRTWIKIAIPRTGFYKVNFGQLRNLPLFTSLVHPDSVQLGQLRLFTWPGVPVLPEANYCDTCEFREVAIQFVDEGNDGLFNLNADTFYFFALGASDWADLYDPSAPDSTFINHPYERKNYYYLTVSTPGQPVAGAPQRIRREAGLPAPPGATTPARFAARVHYEQDIEYFPDLSPTDSPGVFWEKWFWRSMGAGNLFTTAVDAPGIDSTLEGSVRLRQWGIDAFDTCYVPIHYASHLLDVSVNGTALGEEGWDSSRPFSYQAGTTALRTHNALGVSIPVLANCGRRIDRSALAWIDLRYQRMFVPIGDELTFDSSPAGGDYLYQIGPFGASTPPRVFDVTDAYAPIEIDASGYAPVAGGSQLSFGRSETGRHRYRIVQDGSIVVAADEDVFGAPATSLQNLRGRTNGADYLLVYYDAFQAAADTLARWRANHLPLDGVSGPFAVETVPISALYDQFSGGRTDPLAIRNFLRAAFYNWTPRPTFVTLLGDASYDFKNFLGRAPAGQPGTLVPSYENGFASGKQFATDDWLLNVDDAGTIIPDFFGSRIPAGDPATALEFVRDKVLFYERSAPGGAYRNRIMLVADDNYQGANDDPLHWRHLAQTSELDSVHTPQHLDRAYVYLHTYPDGPGSTKPGAKADIKRIVNEGVLMFNFIGHGSPFKMSDETVLSDVDAGTFTNAARPTLFVAASCDVGKYNDPTVQSLGERLLLAPSGGAVGVISATEIAYTDLNAALNWALYDQIFDRSAANGQYHFGVAQALLIAKILTSYNARHELDNFNITNNSKYQLMGDAALRLNLPRLWVDLSYYACDTCTAALPDLKRGSTVTFRGRVLDRPGGAPVALAGTADMLIEDSPPQDRAPDCPLQPGCNDPPIEYWYKAGPMYRGDVAVAGGVLQGKFVVPVEARGGARGRIRAYVLGQAAGQSFESDGAGSIRAQVSPGVPPGGDDAGPIITLSFGSGSTVVKPDATLRVDLYDPSGILITGHTLQNGIVVTLDENTTARVDITSSFRYAKGSYTTGNAVWVLPNLSPGKHTVRVSAADNLAAGLGAASHRSSAILEFEVTENPPLSILGAYLFPNPTNSGRLRSGGQFVIETRGDSVNALLRVYTVSGRLIRTLRSMGRQGQIQIAWDGLDDEGMMLANGTYLFRVQINPRDETGASSARQKAVAEGKIVILNH
jgi:hypothetical protein